MGKGGGGAPQPTSQTVNQTNLPEYARPYFEDLLQRGQAASQVQYQPYQGERVAGFTPLQQQGFGGVQGLGPSPLTSAGAGLTGLAAQQATQASQYQPMAPQQTYQGPQFQGMGLEYLSTQAPQLQQYQMGPTPMARAAQTGAAAPVSGPQLQQYAMGPAERARTGSFAQPGTAEAYMSPYMQNVVDIQTREAQRQADIARTQRGAQAVGAGAFGGSRQAIMEAEAARNLALQKGDIQAQGLQSAYQQAQQAYQTDAQRQLQAQLANQQAGLTVGQQNLASALQTQGLGAQTGMQAQLANQQAQQQALMANQQARQQAALANQQAGLTTQQQNLAALLGTQQLGAQTGLQSQQLNQAAQLQAQQQALGQNQAQNLFNQQNAQLAAQYGLSGLQAAEQSRQFGAGLGMQGVQQLLGAGAQLGQLGQTQFGQQAAAAQAQQQAGAAQQAQQQDILNKQYEDFMQQTTYPQSQLQFYSSLLRGVPVAPQQTMYQYQAAPSMASQIGGLGMGALGLSKAFGAKDGGEVPGYANGGITGGGEGQPTTLEVSKIKTALLKGADPRSMPPSIALLLAVSDPRVKEAIAMRQGAKTQMALDQGRQQPQRTVLDDEMAGLAGLDVPEETFAAASGGIVAFQQAGSVDVNAPTESTAGMLYREYISDPLRRRSEEFRKSYEQEQERERLLREAYKAKPGFFEQLTPEQRAARETQRAGILATLPPRFGADSGASRVPSTVGEPEQLDKGPTSITAPVPKPDLRQPIAPARPVASASQAIVPSAADAEINKARDIVSGLRTGLPTGEDEAKRTREELRKAIPDDLQQRLDSFKSEAAEALKERDKDRWLAVAMGGFAAAAGSSPYALRNFAEGLGLTTKEMMSINKDFRKLQQERNNLMRAEERQARAESLGIEQAAQAARRDVDKRRDAIAGLEANIGVKAADIYGRRENVVTETKSAERRTAMIYSDRSDKNALTKRIEVLTLKDAKGATTPDEKKELTSLVNQLGVISGAKKTKSSSVDAEKLPMITAQIQMLRKKGDPQSLYMAKLLEERAGIELPDAAGAAGKTSSGASVSGW